MTGLLAGVDIGTTWCKAVVLDTAGRHLAEGRTATPWRRVPTGAEIAPDDLFEAALEAVLAALAAAPDARVAAVGVAGMAETGVLSDQRGTPVVPGIAWYDSRGENEAARLAADFGAPRFSGTTGLPATRLCTLSKLAWMRAHVPASRQGVRWLNVAEWVVSRLGGRQQAEASLSSRTGFLDLPARRWWPAALEWAEAGDEFLPPLATAGTSWGRISHGPERVRGATLTVAGHDHLCASVGAGATRPGDVFDSCGTAEAFVRALQPLVEADEITGVVDRGLTVGWHVLPGLQAVQGGFPAGATLQHVLDLLGVAADASAWLDEAALAAPSDAHGLVVHDVTAATARITGVGPQASPGALWRAALEAVTGHGAGVLADVEAVAGPARRLVVTGGWATSAAARALKAALAREVAYPAAREAGARGAALLAGCAAGVYGGVSDLPAVDADVAGPTIRRPS